MQIDQVNCKQLLEKYGINPNKSKGQNYLINPSFCKRIADSLSVEEGDKVLEIGPGIGSLTHYLDEKTNNLDVIDIDGPSCRLLNDLYQDVKIINQDILKSDISLYQKIISNVPYAITSELIEYILLEGKNLKECVFMVQEDAYKRIVSLKGKDYGPLSILISLKGNVKTLFKVGPNEFYPRPKCISVVFKIDLSAKTRLNEKDYRKIKAMFLNRRKTLINNLSSLTSKDNAVKALTQLGVPLTVRPEEINPETYLKLVSLI